MNESIFLSNNIIHSRTESDLSKQIRSYRIKNLLISVILGYSCFCNSYAQDNTANNSRHKIGFISGYGGQITPEVQYSYEVLFLQAQYFYSLLRKKGWSIESLFQPQYNLTKYRPVDNVPIEIRGYELGVNMGLSIKKNLFKNCFGLYLLLSLGPHYVSGTPERQSPGFIFSDNIFVGVQIKISKNVYLDIRPGFRHISNADIKQPNGGVNTALLSGGFIVTLP